MNGGKVPRKVVLSNKKKRTGVINPCSSPTLSPIKRPARRVFRGVYEVQQDGEEEESTVFNEDLPALKVFRKSFNPIDRKLFFSSTSLVGQDHTPTVSFIPTRPKRFSSD